MTETKYSTHVYDLSIKRVDVPVDLAGGSIKVLAVKGDCFVQLNDKSQDPINLLHVANIKTQFTKFYLSNNVQVGGYVAIIVGKHCEFELTTNIARAIHEPLLFPPQNIPAHLLGKVIDTPKIINVWNIENATLRHTFDVSDRVQQLGGIFFRPDGLKIYIMGQSTPSPGFLFGKINEFTLTNPWDTSIAFFTYSRDVSAQTNNPIGLFFNPDGNIMCFVDGNTGNIIKYTLTTAWDTSTATFNTSFLIPNRSPIDFYISPTGHKMYIIEANVHKVTELNLTTAWDITTAVFNHSFDISHQLTHLNSIFLSPDGLCLYVTGETPQKVIAFRLLNAWDITTAVYIQSFDYSLIFQDPIGMFFNPDGSKMYTISGTVDNIYEFDL